MLNGGIEEIPGRHDGIHEGIRKRLFSRARSQVKHHDGILGCRQAIFAAEQISLEQFNFSASLIRGSQAIKLDHGTRRSGETAQPREAAFEKIGNDSCANEP